MRRNLIFLLIIALMLVACVGDNDTVETEVNEAEVIETETDETSEDVVETDENVLVVGLEATYPPFSWTQKDDSNGGVPINGTNEFTAGYDVEIAKIIAEGLEKELVFERIDWEGLEPALRSNTIDAIIAGMSPLESRKESMDFSDIYYLSEFIIVVKKDGPYANAKSIHDFAGATISGQINTSHYDAIDQMEGVIKDPAAIDFGSMRLAIESGIIDGYIAELPEGTAIEASHPELTYIQPDPGFDTVIEEVSIAVGLRKGSDMREPINEILAGISQEERDELMSNAMINQPRD